MRKRLTDKLERVKSAASSSGVHRQISDDFQYNKKKLKHLKKILHNVNVALGTMVSALNEFSRVKGPDISPDGMLGGLGYIIPIRDIKEALNQNIHSLSNVADCLADELTNPRWNAEDDKEVKELIKEKEKLEDRVEEETSPESVGEAEPDEVEPEDIEPEDIVTSREVGEDFSDCKTAGINKTAEDKFARLVKDTLVQYKSVGKS